MDWSHSLPSGTLLRRHLPVLFEIQRRHVLRLANWNRPGAVAGQKDNNDQQHTTHFECSGFRRRRPISCYSVRALLGSCSTDGQVLPRIGRHPLNRATDEPSVVQQYHRSLADDGVDRRYGRLLQARPWAIESCGGGALTAGPDHSAARLTATVITQSPAAS